MASDHAKPASSSIRELLLAVHAQLVFAGRTVRGVVLKALGLVHHAARAIEPPLKSQRAAGRQRPLLVLAQPGADLVAVQRLDHQPPARREHAPELAQRSRSPSRPR